MKCRYKFKEAKTAPCDEATQTKTISLKKGGEGCPLTKEIPCTKKGKRKNNGKGSKFHPFYPPTERFGGSSDEPGVRPYIRP